MAGLVYPGSGHPYSERELRKRLDPLDPRYRFHRQNAVTDVVKYFDDFTGKTINTFDLAVANGGGAGVASYAIQLLANGYIRGTTGTANGDTASASAISPKIFAGTENPWVQISFKIDVVTEFRVEVGFCDVVPGSTKSAINSLVTPTVNTAVASCALAVFDHTGSTNTVELVTIGSAIGAQKIAANAGNQLVAATRKTVRIHNQQGIISWFLDGIPQPSPATALAVTKTDLMAIWFRVAASSATGKLHDVDYIYLEHDRAA